MNGLFFTILFLPMLVHSSMFESPVGPYWFTFNRFEKCPKEGSKEVLFDFHLRKMNRTTVALYGNYSFKREFDDSIKLRNEFSLWGNGGWRSNAYNLDFDRNICKNFQAVLGKTFDMLVMKFGFNVQKAQCVFPIGEYKVDEIVVSNWHFKSLPVLIYGSYRVTCTFYSVRNELLGCLRVVIDIIRRY